MRSRAALPALTPARALVALCLVVLSACAVSELSEAVIAQPTSGASLAAAIGKSARPNQPGPVLASYSQPSAPHSATTPASESEPPSDSPSTPAPAGATNPAAPVEPAATTNPAAPVEPAGATNPAAPVELAPVEPAPGDPAAPGHCADAPTLLADGSVPPAPPHEPLGVDVDVPGDRPVYVLPGNPGDARVIVYLHGMCGDVTAADYFREAVRAHGTLLALRGDTPCANGRFKWRDDASKIQARIRNAFQRVNAQRGGELKIQTALLFGYSQGADRAEKVAGRFPKQYPRIVLGGTPTKASPTRLGQAQRVAFLGGELETTGTMRAGHDALAAAGITTRFFTLDCAYHGYFGSHPESQLSEVLDWVSSP